MEVNLMDILRELKRIEKSMITKVELNRALETVAVLSNPDTMLQIKKSEEDIVQGNVREISSIEEI